MVFLNEVLNKFLDDIPLAPIQRLWLQHDGALAHFLCSCMLLAGHRIPRPLDRTSGSCSMTSTFARCYTVGFFPMGPSQGTGVSRRSDNTNGLSCSSACCLYFGGPHGAATCEDIHSKACSSLPRHARWTL
ncbi:DUF4817 domain-containing protein [Trichonephila clavipes]|uniref:DUF4817 domain-containing protein n=1 Tax=Trichonephila clavipes TaxID=2585209 RepID=A0A8X6S4Y9_TRICX|nr:DUF4817 domain-containing protein [Trichonephila clavipes]